MRGMLVGEAFVTPSFLYQYHSVSAASRRLSFSVSSAIRFLFLDLTCFIVENMLSHTYVLRNIQCIFIAKSFSLRNPSSPTNFQKLSKVSYTVGIAHFH